VGSVEHEHGQGESYLAIGGVVVEKLNVATGEIQRVVSDGLAWCRVMTGPSWTVRWHPTRWPLL
jgi:hypothetical protein